MGRFVPVGRHDVCPVPLSANVGKNALSIKGGRLTVNAAGHGAVKDGDAVLVDRDGQVYVNGEKRPPQ